MDHLFTYCKLTLMAEPDVLVLVIFVAIPFVVVILTCYVLHYCLNLAMAHQEDTEYGP